MLPAAKWTLIIAVSISLLTFGCRKPANDTDLKATVESSDWSKERQRKQQLLDAHLATFKEEAKYFSKVPMSVKGVPYILFKTFPVLFPEIWTDDEFLDLGLPKDPNGGLPIGLGLTKDPQRRLKFREDHDLGGEAIEFLCHEVIQKSSWGPHHDLRSAIDRLDLVISALTSDHADDPHTHVGP